VTAEGIETSEQLRIVREAGADFLQGYLVREPVAADGVLSLLGGWPASPQTLPSGGDAVKVEA
jgi:EAL domain-containing protein (putative c-di-GMP-specific phosphodiesterase class I)